MRGGILYIAKRYSKSSNKYIKCCDSREKSKYWHGSNLYGWGMI